MRGKVTSLSTISLTARITPAYAGKRKSTLACMPEISGSPPPMRGKERLCIYGNWELGITPAYAGKRPLMFSQIPLKKDHPRLCGEKSTALVAGILSVGSPPPMRGKEFASYVNIFASGITPAYAGKRPFSTALTAFSRDQCH